MAFIQVDYDNAIAQAKKLEAAADHCSEVSRTISSQGGDSERYWRGRAGDAMRIKMEETAKELEAVKGQLQSTAAAIRRVAEELREKDQQLASMFR